MPNRVLTRRAALVAFGAVAATPIVAAAQPAVRFGNISVDVGPLRANVGDPTAAWVESALPGLLAQAFAPYGAPGHGGASLVAQIDWVYLGPNSGTGPAGSSQDTITGVLLVHGSRGSVPVETPLRAITSFYQSGVDQALRVESNESRVVALSRAFAGWAPRQLGL
jgi:hypothetical protein